MFKENLLKVTMKRLAILAMALLLAFQAAAQDNMTVEKAEDSAHQSGDVGAFMLGVRNDTPTALCGTNGDYCPIAVDSYGRSLGRTEFVEDSSVNGAELVTAMGAVKAGSISTGFASSGDWTYVYSDNYGRLWSRTSGERRNPTSTPTVTAATTDYTAGDCVGGLQTITNAFSTIGGTIKRIVAVDEGAEAQDLDVIIFNANPSTSTIADNAAPTIADADLLKIVAVVPIREHFSLGSKGASMASTDIPLNSGATSFYALAIARGSAYYYNATDALSFVFDIESD